MTLAKGATATLLWGEFASLALAARVTLVTRNVDEFARLPLLNRMAWQLLEIAFGVTGSRAPPSVFFVEPTGIEPVTS